MRQWGKEGQIGIYIELGGGPPEPQGAQIVGRPCGRLGAPAAQVHLPASPAPPAGLALAEPHEGAVPEVRLPLARRRVPRDAPAPSQPSLMQIGF